MANFLQWGVTFLADTLGATEVAAETVVYTRTGGGAAERRYPISAVPTNGLKVTAQPGEVSNAEVAVNERDFLIRVADFPAAFRDPDQRAPEPREDDWITQTIAGRKYVFRVAPPTYGNEPAWRYADATQTRFRVHAKLLRVE